MDTGESAALKNSARHTDGGRVTRKELKENPAGVVKRADRGSVVVVNEDGEPRMIISSPRLTEKQLLGV